MGRKIGNYIDPESGETHYMDVGNLAKLAIIPEQVVRFKDDRNTLVNLRSSLGGNSAALPRLNWLR